MQAPNPVLVAREGCCEESSPQSHRYYIPCNAPAVEVVYLLRDDREYRMCAACAHHNIKNRGGVSRGEFHRTDNPGSYPPHDLAALAAAEVTPPDRLLLLRSKVARVRDLRAAVADMKERTTAANKELDDLAFRELPDLFQEVGVARLGLDPDGNLPAYDAELKDHFKANIVADWPPEQREAGFALLERRGAGDLVKTVITVELGRGEGDLAEGVCRTLDEMGVPYIKARAVSWNTLTSWLREQVKKYGKTFSAAELDAIGGRVGKVVEAKPRKV